MILLPSLFVAAQTKNLKEEARIYRDKGYAAQGIGDLDTAMTYYQKAIELDPRYAVAYNDLGVIYDIKGFQDRAEASYIKCLKIDPYYQNAYFNLANLYEEKGDLRKAATYWKKRIQIGDPNDPWTQKAKQRLRNIGMLVEDIGRQLKRQEAVDSGGTAQRLFINAKSNYLKGEYAAALKDAVTAQYLDPSNRDIEKFIEKIREKILSGYSR